MAPCSRPGTCPKAIATVDLDPSMIWGPQLTAPPGTPWARFQRLPLGVDDCLGSGRRP